MLSFWLWFAAVAVMTAVAALGTGLFSGASAGAGDDVPAAYADFKSRYLVVYLLVMFSDWLQGPYVYALYDYYGFDKGDIGTLFVAGFLSSMALGTVVGSLADKFGRKRMCVAFGVFYSLSCLTKLVNDYNVLLLGRILGGIATSLLFSVFETWMVSEHHARGFSDALLGRTFSAATFGNSVVAIVAGLVASFVADNFGFVAPFMVSLAVLVVASLIVAASWSENYGDATIDVSQTFGHAWRDLQADSKIPLLGAVSALFEGSMYTFVFMWTPQLLAGAAEGDAALPFGLIFACFMVAVMLGSTLFGAAASGHAAVRSVIGGEGPVSMDAIGQVVLLAAAAALAVPAITTDQTYNFAAFLLFETCCGVYWPCFGTLRGTHVPEATRATITNFFRVPLNLLVVLVLTKVGELDTSTVFTVCAIWLGLAVILHSRFAARVREDDSIGAAKDNADAPEPILIAEDEH